MSGRARLSVRVFVWVCDLCVCVGDRLRMGAGTGRGGGCGRCPRGPPRLGSVAAGAAAVWAGVGAALWFPGRVARRLGAGCRARFSFCSVLAALVFSSRGAAVWITPAVSVCVCVLEGGSLGMRGVTVTPAEAAAAALPLAPHPGGGSGAMASPQGRGWEARRLRPPTSRGRGCRSPLSSLLFGAPRLPLSPSSRPECQTGGGDEPTTPPSRFPWKPLGGDAAPPPRSGTRRTPGC